MSFRLLGSLLLMTAGPAIVGVQLVRLIRARTRPRAFAADLLVGVGSVLAGIGMSRISSMPMMMAALALAVSGGLLRSHDRARLGRDRSAGADPDRLIR